MPNKAIINTTSAPAAIGTYSQAVKVNTTVYLSGQIPLDADTMELVGDDTAAQITHVFKNLTAICHAAGGTLNDIVKLNVYLTDLSQFALVNQIMAEYFDTPYPARAAVQVSALPLGSQVEMDGVMVV